MSFLFYFITSVSDLTDKEVITLHQTVEINTPIELEIAATLKAAVHTRNIKDFREAFLRRAQEIIKIYDQDN